MITARIIVLQINHISVGMSEKFVKQKINKLTVFLSNHDLLGFVDVLIISQKDGTTS